MSNNNQLSLDTDLPSPVINKKELYSPMNITRRDQLFKTLDLLKESRSSGTGANYITSANPDYERLDSYPGGIDGIIKKSEKRTETARRKLTKACGLCAVESCIIKDNIVQFRDKYDGSKGTEQFKNAKKFRDELSVNPIEPC